MNEQQPSPSDPPKIVVDDDWKTQAQAEKQKLAEQEREVERDRRSIAGHLTARDQLRPLPPTPRGVSTATGTSMLRLPMKKSRSARFRSAVQQAGAV